tara:strand:- start:1484 stop:2626 length:1143 start_codon:yes stop_codon:yes gene_type:complete
MNLLFLTDGITPFVKGGMQRHSQLAIESLACRGHHITVYHYTSPGELVKGEEAFSNDALNNITLVRFDYMDKGRLPGHYIKAQKEISQRYLDQIKRELTPFDFIYTKGFMGWALLSNRAALKTKHLVGVKFHGMNMFQKQPGLKSFFSKYMLRPTTREILKKADYVFSYGGKISDIIKAECSTPVLEVATGVDANWLRVSPITTNTRRKFLFMGRFDRVKGLPELHRALKLLISKRKDWEFHFIGPIPVDEQLEVEQTIYHGAIYDQEKLKDIIQGFDVLVNCSISEGMPNVILEAMASGLAIIATDVGASSVLVKNQVNGLLVSEARVGNIFRSLVTALEINDLELLNWKKESLKLAQDLTWDSLGPKLEESIQKCILA